MKSFLLVFIATRLCLAVFAGYDLTAASFVVLAVLATLVLAWESQR